MSLSEFVYRYFNFNTICEVLTIFGFCYFIVRTFILKKPPVPSSGNRKVTKELLEKCLNLLKKQDKGSYGIYQVPYEILVQLQADLHNEAALKRLLCSICDHYGINGEYIRLVTEARRETEYAGNIATNGAFTTIKLELKPGYTLDAVIAILAHEAAHLHLFYKGIRLKNDWENEILTDTATVYYGFGEYMYKGYSVLRGEFAFTYQKVGYISQEDVKYIMSLL
ncbi:MAG: hypothetical protein IJ409_00385 [Lachnospiraceae bacterium]|nr:hypothetical protein [Lachnospiraceae bacterium]